MARLAPLALLLTAALAAVLAGPPGSVGEADGSLYADVAACAGSEAWRSPPCLRSSPTSAWLPTLVLGRTARLLGGAGAAPRVLRGFGAALALACLLLTFLLASAPGRSAPGLVASLLLLLCTPLLDRARAGGVEIWLFAELLALAWLLRRPMEGLLATLGAAFLATAACATHPYALVVLPLLLFCRVPQTLPHGPARVGGRLWLGWLDGPTLAAAIGGLALVGAIWTPDASAILWSRLVGLYRMDHAPFRVAAQTWIQGERLHSPPLAATLDTLVFTTPLPLLLAGLAGVGVRLGRRDEDSAPSHAALLLLLFGWLLVVALQGSPVADGADHRLVLLGLLAPAVGPGLRGIQSLVAQAWPRFARVGVPWVLSLSALPAGARAVEGLPPGSGLAPSGPALVARGLSPLPAPRLDPGRLEAHTVEVRRFGAPPEVGST